MVVLPTCVTQELGSGQPSFRLPDCCVLGVIARRRAAAVNGTVVRFLARMALHAQDRAPFLPWEARARSAHGSSARGRCPPAPRDPRRARTRRAAARGLDRAQGRSRSRCRRPARAPRRAAPGTARSQLLRGHRAHPAHGRGQARSRLLAGAGGGRGACRAARRGAGRGPRARAPDAVHLVAHPGRSGADRRRSIHRLGRRFFAGRAGPWM